MARVEIFQVNGKLSQAHSKNQSYRPTGWPVNLDLDHFPLNDFSFLSIEKQKDQQKFLEENYTQVQNITFH